MMCTSRFSPLISWEIIRNNGGIFNFDFANQATHANQSN